MTRRRFLQGSLLGTLVLTGGLVVGGGLLGKGDYRTAGLGQLSDKEAAVLSAAAARVLRGAKGLDQGALLRFVDRYLGALDRGLVQELRGLLHLVEHSAMLSSFSAGGGRRFTALSGEEQDRVLAGWQGSGLALRRQGFQAIKALCCLAHYQDPRSFAAIGYSGPMIHSSGQTSGQTSGQGG